MTDTNPSPLRAIYEQWQAARDECNDFSGTDEARSDAAFDRMIDYAQQATDFEPKTAEDVALMVVIADDGGDWAAGDAHQAAVVARCYAVAGIERRNTRGA